MRAHTVLEILAFFAIPFFPLLFYPLFLAATGNAAQVHNKTEDDFTICSLYHFSRLRSPQINGLPTHFLYKYPQIHLMQLKISSWVSIRTLCGKKIPKENETACLAPWRVNYLDNILDISNTFPFSAEAAENMFFEKQKVKCSIPNPQWGSEFDRTSTRGSQLM